MSARVLTAAVGIPIVLWLVADGGWPLAVVLLLILAQAGREWLQLLAGMIGQPLTGAVLPAAAALAAVWAGAWAAGLAGSLAGLVLALFIAAFWVLRAAARAGAALSPESAWKWLAGLQVGAVYVAWGGSLLLLLRREGGAVWPFLLLLAVWTCDTASYAAGMRWGRRRLAPAVSPGKSWEGWMAGAAGALLIGVGAAWAGYVPLSAGIGVGLVAAIGGLLGDLAESLLKRAAGTKDSGGLLPGHGGFLDRLDSLLFCLPAVYCLFLFLGAEA